MALGSGHGMAEQSAAGTAGRKVSGVISVELHSGGGAIDPRPFEAKKIEGRGSIWPVSGSGSGFGLPWQLKICRSVVSVSSSASEQADARLSRATAPAKTMNPMTTIFERMSASLDRRR